MIYGGWTALCSLDVFMEHYASATLKTAYDQAWLAPKWGWSVSIIGFFIITVILVIEGSYRHVLKTENAHKETITISETKRKEAEERLYEGHPILVLEVGRVAGVYAMAPPEYVLYLKNCGERPARWINVDAVKSSGEHYRLTFGRISVIEPKQTESLSFAVEACNTLNKASLENFLSDAPADTYCTWYDLDVYFRDTDESGGSDKARLVYYHDEKVLGSAEVPYTKKGFKPQ